MKRLLLLWALTLAGAAQTPDNELLRSGQPEQVLAGQPTTLDWAEALLQLNPEQLRPDRLVQQLDSLPETAEVLLIRGRARLSSSQGTADVRRAYALASGSTKLRAAASLAIAEARAGRSNQAMKLLSEALHGAHKLDQSWLDFEVAWASSQVYSSLTPDQPEWGSLLSLRQRCRQRQDWFWAARAGAAIFERLRSNPDWQRTVEYALEAFNDAEKSGSRLLLWSTVQRFATGLGVAPREELGRLLAERAQNGPFAFAYWSGLRWLRWEKPEYLDLALAAAETDWEHYEGLRSKIRNRTSREDLTEVHEFEKAHQNDRTFLAFGDHLEDCYYFLKLAGLETEPERKAGFLWESWNNSASLHPVNRYNLLLSITDGFEKMGRLPDLFRANLLMYQHNRSQTDPVNSMTRIYGSPLREASALSSDWDLFFGELIKSELSSEIQSHEHGIFQALERSQSSASRSSEFVRLLDLYTFQGRLYEAVEAARAQVTCVPEMAYSHRQLARALSAAGQDQEALQELEEALELESQGKGFEEEVSLLCSQAGCWIRLGRLERAEKCLDRAQKLAEQRNTDLMVVEANRSTLLRKQKRWIELEDLLNQRISQAKPLQRFRLLLALGELQFEQHKNATATFAQAEALADQLGGGAAGRLWLAWREHLESEQSRRLLDKAQSELRRLVELAPASNRAQFLAIPAVASVLRGQPLVDHTIGEQLQPLTKEAFLTSSSSLRQRVPLWEQLAPVTVPALLEVQQRLGPEEVFLSFTALPHQVVLVGCDRRQFFLRCSFFEQSALEEQVQRLHQGVSRPGGSYEAASQRLYNNLLAPLEKVTEGKQVWLACQGPLMTLPWSALQDLSGKFVVQHWTGHKLWWGMSQEKSLDARIEQALLVGAPGHFQLEGVIAEIRTIAKTLRGSRSLTGSAATRANLARLLPACRWLHLAAHSSLNRSALNQSYVELSDGPLPLSQLYGLKLRPQTTVVLSSCQTAMGQAQPGKDVLSLGSGFRVTGAGQVLATLWPVDDSASVEFFRDLYTRLQKQASLSTAVYATSRHLLKTRAWTHPFYWAPYQLEGEMFRR